MRLRNLLEVYAYLAQHKGCLPGSNAAVGSAMGDGAWLGCRVQFDRRELGVELVKDVDVMPIDPTENLPSIFTPMMVRVLLPCFSSATGHTSPSLPSACRPYGWTPACLEPAKLSS